MALTKATYSMIDGAFVNVLDYGAVGDGVADDTAAIQAAIDSLTEGGTVYLPQGVYKTTATIIDNAKTINLVGVGSTEDAVGSGNVTILKPTGAIVGVKFNGNRSGAQNLTIEGDNGAADTSSHGIWARSSRGNWQNLVVMKCRGDGIYFTLGNCSLFQQITVLSNKRHGLNIDGTSDPSSTNDANACDFINIDARANGGIGIRTGVNSTFANRFFGITCQGNTSYGFETNGDYNKIYGIYLEGNDAGSAPAYDFHFGSTADYNEVYGYFSNYPAVPTGTSGVYLDSSASQRNYFQNINFNAETLTGAALRLGNTTGGIGGYILFTGDNGTTSAITLEGTSGTQSLLITSSGAGKFGIKPDFVAYRVYTVATLPSASTLGAGAKAFVSDANATTFASIVAAGGANNVPVYSDGTNWRIG